LIYGIGAKLTPKALRGSVGPSRDADFIEQGIVLARTSAGIVICVRSHTDPVEA